MSRKLLSILVVAGLVTLLWGGRDVWAGCGCDHPTPCPAPVLPAFASPGDTILLTGSGFSTKKDGNTVTFGIYPNSRSVKVAAVDGEHIKVAVPVLDVFTEQKVIGPMPIEVKTGSKVAASYTRDQFTLLSRPLILKEGEGDYVFMFYPLAVDSFGVLHMPFDISRISRATNFAVYVKNLALEFGTEEVVVFNKQGYNLNLFTMDVDGIEKQWGPWYGAGTLKANTSRDSNVLTYWRHDFIEYNIAHSAGGTHYPLTEGDNGSLLHPDGTVHVDHDHLDIAIAAQLRDPKDPENPDLFKPLEPGKIVWAEIHVRQLLTEDPDAYEHLTDEQVQTLSRPTEVATPYTGTIPLLTDLSRTTSLSKTIDTLTGNWK